MSINQTEMIPSALNRAKNPSHDSLRGIFLSNPSLESIVDCPSYWNLDPSYFLGGTPFLHARIGLSLEKEVGLAPCFVLF